MALQQSQDARKSLAGIVVHNTVPGQEAGYDLRISGKSGGVKGSRLNGATGSNYRAVRFCAANEVPSLCTRSAAYGRETGGRGRPDSVRTWDKLPRKSLLSSNEKSLSVLESGLTIYESLHHANGVMSGPAGIDQLKSEIPPTLSKFRAWVGWNRGATSGTSSKDRVFFPPTVANHTLNGDGNGGNTWRKVQHSRVKQCTNVDVMPTIFERDECVDVSNTASNALSLNSSSRVQNGDFSNTPGIPDNIHALEPSHDQRDSEHPVVFPPCLVNIAIGERADCPPEFTRAVGGRVKLGRPRLAARAHIFGGSKATRTHACTILLDTGSPSTFILSTVWEGILACGSASQNGGSETP